MIYGSIHGEVDTELIMEICWRLEKDVIFPRICWDTKKLIPVRIDGPDQLRKGRWGLLEPCSLEPYPIENIDIILTPGLAFDLSGNRLGRGGGYYDRFLAQKHNASIIALAFSCQMQQHVPININDKMVDILITENMTVHSDRLIH